MKRRGKEKTYALFCRFIWDTKGALFWLSQHAGKFFILAKRTWTSEVLNTSGFPYKSWGLQCEPEQSLGAVVSRVSVRGQPVRQSFLGWQGSFPGSLPLSPEHCCPLGNWIELYRRYLRLCKHLLPASDFLCSAVYVPSKAACLTSRAAALGMVLLSLALKLTGRCLALI